VQARLSTMIHILCTIEVVWEIDIGHENVASCSIEVNTAHIMCSTLV
jgi:hypothetical protein